MPEEKNIYVSWYEHDCDWITKYCDEYHRSSALVPASVLAQYGILNAHNQGA